MIKHLLNNNSLPHLFFYGMTGTFKTTTITSIVNYIYGKSNSTHVLKLTASDGRGINSVRDEIKCFAEKTIILNNDLQLIILDDIGSMTYDAQSALRRIIEIYSSNVRFCLLCNNKCKLIQAIKSRCLMIKFKLPTNHEIKQVLTYILITENKIEYSNIIDDIVYISSNALRKAINTLQVVTYHHNITSELCYYLTGFSSIQNIALIYLFYRTL